jgi:hypothetical protein
MSDETVEVDDREIVVEDEGCADLSNLVEGQGEK